MLSQIADGVLVHQSDFIQSNAVIVQGRSGALVIDPGVRGEELGCIANDLGQSGQPVVAGFSTHPHWDHLLWDAQLGSPPRYGTARCAATVRERLSGDGAQARVAAVLPPDIADQIPLGLLGHITGLDEGTAHVPWNGPRVRIMEHQAHAAGHAALLIEEDRVLVAGDLLSDVLVPVLDVNAADPFEDYLVALRLLEAVAGEVDVLVPGHGSVGGPAELHARIDQDRAYVLALRDADTVRDRRIGPTAGRGREWVTEVHTRQAQRLAERAGSDATAAGHSPRH